MFSISISNFTKFTSVIIQSGWSRISRSTKEDIVPVKLEIALFCLYGLRVGYLIWRYQQSGRYFAPGFSIVLGFGSLLWLGEAVLGTMSYEQQISTGPFPDILFAFCTIPPGLAMIGMVLGACTEQRWPHPTLEMRLVLGIKYLLIRVWKMRTKKPASYLL